MRKEVARFKIELAFNDARHYLATLDMPETTWDELTTQLAILESVAIGTINDLNINIDNILNGMNR